MKKFLLAALPIVVSIIADYLQMESVKKDVIEEIEEDYILTPRKDD